MCIRDRDVADVAKNSQMFGHFTIVGQENNTELITINKKGMKLHAWIRRAASKVTIDVYKRQEIYRNVA